MEASFGRTCNTLYTDKHCRLLKAAQKSALILILRAMKSTPAETLESDHNIVPIDLRLEELQRMEAIKLLTNNMDKKVTSKKLTSLTHLGHQAKQVLTVMSKHQKISINAIQIPSEIPPSLDTYIYIPNLSVTTPTKFSHTKVKKIILKKSNKMFSQIL